MFLSTLLDALREVQKYSGPEPMQDAKVNPNVYDHIHMKLFRAQRNLYISGFSLFLWLLVEFCHLLCPSAHLSRVLKYCLILLCFFCLVTSTQYDASGCHFAKPGCCHHGGQRRSSATNRQCCESS